MRKRRKDEVSMAQDGIPVDEELTAQAAQGEEETPDPTPEGAAAQGDMPAGHVPGGKEGAPGAAPEGALRGDEILLSSADIEKINKALAERDEYLGMAQRITADFDNYRKRTASTRAEAHGDGIREAVSAILPTIDNLDRAVDSMKDADEKLVKGVDMIRRGLLDALGKLGLSEIEALGAAFDPDIHEAAMRSPAEDGQADGQIVEVFQKGYRLGDKVVRYAMVRVAHEA